MTEFDIQFELDWEKYSIFRKGKKMNRMIDTAVMPDFSRKIYLVKKDRKGHNDWYELDLSDKTILEDDKWFKNFCDKNKFFAWSYYPYGTSR